MKTVNVSRTSPEKRGTYNARGIGARVHDAHPLGVQDRIGRSTLLVPPTSAYPSFVEDSKEGGGQNESVHLHLPLGN